MNQLKLERVVLILALGLLSSTPARSQTAPHDPKNYVLRDAGELTVGDEIRTRFHRGRAISRVEAIEPQ